MGAPFLSSLLVLVNSKPVSPRMDKPVNTLSWLSHLVSSNLSLVSTRWTPLNHHTVKSGSQKSLLKSPTTSRRLVTIQRLLLLSQSLDGMEIPCLKPLIQSFHQPVHPTNHFVSHFKTSTKSVVLEQSQSVVSKLVSSNQVWLLPSLQSWSPLKSSPSRCITNLSQKLDQVTTLVST